MVCAQSRSSYCSSETLILGHLSTGLEISTWIGDIGGGSGMLCFNRTSNKNKRAKSKFTSSRSDFGGWVNLEGDIAAYLVARDTNSNNSGYNLNLSDTSYISSALEQYLIDPDTTNIWKNRGKDFLYLLGGRFSNDTLVNRQQLIDHVSIEIADFSENYLVNMAFGRNVNLFEASKHIQGASVEMSNLFINAIEQIVKNPSRKPVPTIDPQPSKPGKPYMKYKIMKAAEGFFKDIQDYLKRY